MYRTYCSGFHNVSWCLVVTSTQSVSPLWLTLSWCHVSWTWSDEHSVRLWNWEYLHKFWIPKLVLRSSDVLLVCVFVCDMCVFCVCSLCAFVCDFVCVLCVLYVCSVRVLCVFCVWFCLWFRLCVSFVVFFFWDVCVWTCVSVCVFIKLVKNNLIQKKNCNSKKIFWNEKVFYFLRKSLRFHEKKFAFQRTFCISYQVSVSPKNFLHPTKMFASEETLSVSSQKKILPWTLHSKNKSCVPHQKSCPLTLMSRLDDNLSIKRINKRYPQLIKTVRILDFSKSRIYRS